MKKYLLIAATMFMAVTASAQVMRSRTYVLEKNTMWYGRIGMSINNVAGMPSDLNASSKTGMDIDLGFHKNIGEGGVYWGMEFGFGTRGCQWENENNWDHDETIKASITTWNVKYSPVTFGYKYSVTDDIKIDGHLGIYASYDFTKTYKYDGEEVDIDDTDFDYQEFDAGLQVGVGVWYKRFNLDFTYQRGFLPVATVWNYDEDEKDLHSSNFMIRLGIAF